VRDAMPRLLKGINEGSNRIKMIIDNLKDFSRPEKANLDDVVDINEVISLSVSILASQIKEHTSNFETHCVKNIPFIKGNKQQLEQVIINLLINALQSLTDSKSAVHISTFYNDEMDSVMVTIKDEGVGMSDDIIDRITEPFFTTKIDSGGTGLGLSISYAIINDHNGNMKFESKRGKGTTVIVKLPGS
jgi:signal transduction histidine kinase